MKQVNLTIKRLSLVLMMLFFLTSCQEMNFNTYFKKVNLSHQEWKGTEPLVFDIDIKEGDYPYFINVYFQHDDDYPYANFWFELSVYKPGEENAFVTQRFEVDFADRLGNWLGSGTKDIIQHRIPIAFKNGITFDNAGVYRFEMKQLMRTDPLPMISAGLLLEKGKQKHTGTQSNEIEETEPA